MNGSVDIDMAPAAAGGTLKVKNSAAWTYTGQRCNNVFCHSNGYATTPVYAQTPLWNATIAGDKCAACHGNSPNTGITGSPAHTAHVVGIHYDDIFNGVSRKLPQGGGAAVNAAHGRDYRSTTINCNICHAATVTANYNDKGSACSGCHNGSTAPLKGDAVIADKSMHVNGVINVNFVNAKIATKAQVVNSAFAAYTSVNSGAWTRKSNTMPFKTYTSGYDVTKAVLSASPAYTTVAGCAVACHSNIPVVWTGSVTCTSCHTRLK
jgi:predicted CxxxxCH...CXXCH cytochrome family protein